ncbi:MAG TPA: hypothetical protein VLA68_01940 [Nitrososphaera sp.]|nr:hypothetical protein [Nitrososphaera sp.]
MTSKNYAEAHQGLCRRCHSNFAFLVELEEREGEDALVQYWYQKIMDNLPEDGSKDASDCMVDHLIEFYQRKLAEVPSKQGYIQKMLYMLHSIKEPFDARAMV